MGSICGTFRALNSDGMEVAYLRSKLLLADEPREDYACIPVAHILECRADRTVVLDERFIPTVLDSASGVATCNVRHRGGKGLLHQRAEGAAPRSSRRVAAADPQRLRTS